MVGIFEVFWCVDIYCGIILIEFDIDVVFDCVFEFVFVDEFVYMNVFGFCNVKCW